MFCQRSCKDEYHAHGGMSLKKIEDKVHGFVAEAMAEVVTPLAASVEQLGNRVAALEWRLFRGQGGRSPAHPKALNGGVSSTVQRKEVLR